MNDDFSVSNPSLGDLYAAHVAAIRSRHDRALDHAGASHAVIYSGNPKVAFLDDNSYPFRANPHFVGWVPLTKVPFSCIVYTLGETPLLIYFQPQDYWHVVPGAPEGFWTEHFDIRIVRDIEDIAAHLPANRENCILIGEIDADSPAFGIDRVNPTAAINSLHYARAIKTGYELAVMRLASRRAAAGHRAAETAFREGLSEFEIHRAYCQAVGHTDAELPYSNIVALNAHGAVLHYTDLDRNPPDTVRSFLIDAGAQVHGYASDITRTYAFDEQRFQDLIDRMDSLQQSIVGKVEAGVDYCDLHIGTHRMLAELLVDAGLATGSPDTLLETGVTSAFFPHGLGHLLGVQVHDVGGFMKNETGAQIEPPGDHPFLRLTRVLDADMVLTIEPGLYVIDLLLANLRDTPAGSLVNWQTVDWLRPYGGIRIEDDVRVLPGDRENLTRDALANAP
jgi:Xaa-Pro dipeptidase